MNLARRHLLTIGCVAFLATRPVLRGDTLVNPDEMSSKDQWVKQTLLGSMDRPVVSFLYNGVSSSQLLSGWRKAPIRTTPLSGGRTQYVERWTDPTTDLEVRVVAVDYADYPAVEWTAYLKNRGREATPVLEQVRGIDATFSHVPEKVVLRTTRGDNFSASSYEPLEFNVDREPRSFQPVAGRPTNGAWPYFNIDCGGHGILLALGWPGQWQAQFSWERDTVMAVGGQETTHLKLEPGEEIRTPLVALVFWQGRDWIDGQNLWRDWFVAHNIPRPNGVRPGQFAGIFHMSHGSAASEKTAIDTYQAQGSRIDTWWMDAGWYESKKGWYAATGVGTWKPDPTRYPHGIRETSDYVRSRGMKFLLWFEPERVYRGSLLWEDHPDWLLKLAGDEDNRLLNLGNPEARQWITDTISRFITEQGVDLYRQDFNVPPLSAWEGNDAPDRRGITENLYVQGYLAFWDDLLRQHPGMLIDSCASGGRRNDLETLRRAVPLWRSDYQGQDLPNSRVPADVFDGNQGHTYGLSLWVPYFGCGEYAEDVYSVRSHLCPATWAGTRLDDPDWPAFRRQLSDYRKVADYFYGDYYPLTPYSKATDVWVSWEFVRRETGDGMVQAFRREFSPYAEVRFKLRGLEPGARYEFTDIDSGKVVRFSGKELMENGLKLKAPSPRTALILTFRKAP